MTVRERMQALLLAGLFLVLLYDSPSGTRAVLDANNLFSLTRNLLSRRIGTRLSGLQRSGRSRNNDENDMTPLPDRLFDRPRALRPGVVDRCGAGAWRWRS